MPILLLKRLSLSAYIFLISGMFLLLLALLQYIAIKLVENRIDEEIAFRSINLSNEAINMIVTKPIANFQVSPDAQAKINALSIELSKLTEKRIVNLLNREQDSEEETTAANDIPVKEMFDETNQAKIDALLEEISSTALRAIETQKSDGNTTGESQIAIDEKHRMIKLLNKETEFDTLREQLEQLEIERLDGNTLVFKTPEFEIERKNLFFDSGQSTINTYFKYLSFATLALGLLSLLFAWLLAKHIAKPLNRLSDGFAELGKGNFKHRVQTDGVKEVEQTLTMFNHTSERLERLQAIEQQYLQQQQLVELGEISRGIAHSLRNPLNTIGLAIEEMSQANTNEKRKIAIAQQARQKIVALDRSIKSLLVLTTSGINRQQTLDMYMIVQDAVMQMGMGSNCEMSTDLEQNCKILGAETEVLAMLTTLLSNAIEACCTTKRPPSIHVVLRKVRYKHQDAIQVEVTDNGQGLSDSIAKDLFKPHISSKAEGAGMGLYIARRIAVLHYKGDIVLKNNEDDDGCCAVLTLCNASN
uniref:sensor histidine kinase n=1 Tax=Ningiella ruwaisensis TaxID=2364274 RepID=UPI00109F8684|nr:HAMP domain-containing sensor histidine kinase [Ningiella ruwaisensis]